MRKGIISVLVILLFAAGIYFYALNVREDIAASEPAPTDPAVATEQDEPSRPAAEPGPEPSEPEPAPAPDPDGPVVGVGSLQIPVELALTDTARQKGLSGRPSLAADSGLLFVFGKPAIYHFWMPDMNFPIDIIWINNGEVIGVDANVPNDFDPANPVYYTPPSPAQYVLEVNAGFAARHGIDAGDSVELPNVQAQ